MMLRLHKLRDLAKLHSGMNVTRKQQADKFDESTVEAHLLNASSFNEVGQYVADERNEVRLERDAVGKHRLHEGDLIFQARGNKLRSLLPPKDADSKPYILSNLFFRIVFVDRAANLMARYLSYYLQTPSCRAQIQARIRGTVTPSISRKDFGDIEVPVPQPAWLANFNQAAIAHENAVNLRYVATRRAEEHLIALSQNPAAHAH